MTACIEIIDTRGRREIRSPCKATTSASTTTAVISYVFASNYDARVAKVYRQPMDLGSSKQMAKMRKFARAVYGM